MSVTMIHRRTGIAGRAQLQVQIARFVTAVLAGLMALMIAAPEARAQATPHGSVDLSGFEIVNSMNLVTSRGKTVDTIIVDVFFDVPAGEDPSAIFFEHRRADRRHDPYKQLRFGVLSCARGPTRSSRWTLDPGIPSDLPIASGRHHDRFPEGSSRHGTPDQVLRRHERQNPPDIDFSAVTSNGHPFLATNGDTITIEMEFRRPVRRTALSIIEA